MASRRLGDAALLLLLVAMVSMPRPQRVGGMDLNLGENVPPAGSSSRVLAALSYPSVRIGPHSWRYFRVEVPQAFAELTITLTRKWTGEHIGRYEGNVPMVCFRFGSPPLPDSVSLESPQAAAMAAAKAEHLSESGKCAWFQSNSSIALTNMQIAAGVWYVGVFSDPDLSRFQSKMISRGNIFTFGIYFTVLGCNSPSLRGHNCSVAVKALRSDTPPPGFTKTKADASGLFSGATAKLGEDSWASLEAQHVGHKEWKHFALEVGDFALKLQVRVVCTSADCNNKTSPAGSNGTTTDGMFYVKYGALPGAEDNGTAMGFAPMAVAVPRRGLWYIGVHNRNATLGLDFDVHRHVESCSSGTTGESCATAVHFMDRVLVEDAQESPFNSFYEPAQKGGLLYSPWFSLSDVTHLANATSGGWTYLFIEVPRGAAGGVLSVQLRHAEKATLSVYARLEGLATPERWDVKIMNLETDGGRRASPVAGNQEKPRKLSFDLVYPAEGIWCIGVHYVKHLDGLLSSATGRQTPQLGPGRRMSSRATHVRRKISAFILQCYRRLLKWTRTAWQEFRSAVSSVTYSRALEVTPAVANHITMSMEADIGLVHPRNVSGTGTSDQPLAELSSESQNSDTVQMHISMHGCVNKCSGKGHCSSSYDSSRLHIISYCHCDAAHGGIDCSTSLLVPREERLHLWTLIGSNVAALLPSFWAIRNQAYSEWVSYVASGVSSGFYHSCDAGGWCVLSYDTLQFLDFWLSFVVVIMTCLSVASLKHDTKAVAHIASAIITAAITKENATNAWNVLLVILMGLTFLLLGWALECWRLRLFPSWLSSIGPIRPVLRMDTVYHRGEQLLNVIKRRFQWFYLTAGLGFLFAAGLSWVLESADTYWIWHSFWHVSIYTSAFVILYSTSKPNWASSDGGHGEGYEPANIQQQASDPEAAPMLRHGVELDAFATERNHRS